MFSDDYGYVTIAKTIASSWHSLATFPVDPSIVNSYTKAAAALFFLVGPDVAALKLANTILGVGAALFVYRSVALLWRPPAGRIALLAMLVWPSVGLWSSLALKDAFSLFASMGAVWCLSEFIAQRRYRWLLAFAAFCMPLQDTRGYLFTLLVGVWPVAMAANWIARRMSWRPVVVSVVGAALLISNVPAGLAVSLGTLANVRAIRENMAENANSAVVEATRVQTGTEGQQFVVVVPGRTTDPARTPTRHVVACGQPLVFDGRDTANLPAPSGGVQVRPGDIVVCTSGRTAPAAPEGAPTQMVVPASGSTVISSGPTASDEGTNAAFNVAYLPRGVAFLVGAPFPWELTRDPFLLAPEMLLWYVVVLFALIGLWIVARARDVRTVYVVLVGLGLAGILSLTEGNVGTLVRHRSMLIPFAVILAAVGVTEVMSRLKDRRSERQRA